MVNELNEVQKVILSLLYSKNAEPIKGATWFQKEMFLISKNFSDIEEDLSFDAYLFGPDSEVADDELSELKKRKFVEMQGNKIALTKEGKDFAKKVYSEDTKKKEIIDRFKEFLNDLSLDELLVFIYFSYPEMTQESTVFQEIKTKRVPLATALVRKNKISTQKAAEIAGLPLEHFMKKLGE
jgi:predicted HTH domain antitoxin